MASTPIYNWPTPDNTDLVKNGALAIRTLGDAIDTTVDTMIPETIFAAKGDLLGASANDTPAVLAVGANGETLVADSSTTTGLRYTAGTVQANPVLNSAFQCWQRGTTVSVSANVLVYTADRWQVYNGPNQAMTVSRQSTNDTTNLPFIQYAARVQRNSGQTGTTETFLSQPLETLNSIPFVGKTVTVSFYARKGADYSPTSSNFKVNLVSGTGTDQNIATYTGGASVATVTNALTTTWTRYTVTGTVGATATELRTDFAWTPTGTAGANDWFEVTGVQLDIGSVALPFRTYAGTLQGELAAAQRYYHRSTAGTAYGWFPAWAGTTSTTAFNLTYTLPVQMRVAPTSIEYGGALRLNAANDAGVSITSLTFASVTTPIMGASTGVSATATTDTFYRIQANNDANAYIGWSAEL
jgi:hypothetical protein